MIGTSRSLVPRSRNCTALTTTKTIAESGAGDATTRSTVMICWNSYQVVTTGLIMHFINMYKLRSRIEDVSNSEVNSAAHVQYIRNTILSALWFFEPYGRHHSKKKRKKRMVQDCPTRYFNSAEMFNVFPRIFTRTIFCRHRYFSCSVLRILMPSGCTGESSSDIAHWWFLSCWTDTWQERNTRETKDAAELGRERGENTRKRTDEMMVDPILRIKAKEKTRTNCSGNCIVAEIMCKLSEESVYEITHWFAKN